MSSLSDQFRRLFSGTLGLLPIVFPNRDQGGTLVHFWRDCPLTFVTSLALSFVSYVLMRVVLKRWSRVEQYLQLTIEDCNKIYLI